MGKIIDHALFILSHVRQIVDPLLHDRSHPVEMDGKLTKFIFAVQLYTVRIITLSDCLGRLRQLLEGLGQLPD
ncbi:hypothetical protein D3C73_1216630 [compost metagenome]